MWGGGRRGNARRLAPARGPLDDAHVRVEAVEEEEEGETPHQYETLGALERLGEASAHYRRLRCDCVLDCKTRTVSCETSR